MKLSKDVERVFGKENLYLEFRHNYVDVSDIGTKLSDKPTVTLKPVGTTVMLVQGDMNGKDKAPIVLYQAQSKCHPNDQFDRSLGRKQALQNLLYDSVIVKKWVQTDLNTMKLKIRRQMRPKAQFTAEQRCLLWDAYLGQVAPPVHPAQ